MRAHANNVCSLFSMRTVELVVTSVSDTTHLVRCDSLTSVFNNSTFADVYDRVKEHFRDDLETIKDFKLHRKNKNTRLYLLTLDEYKAP